MTEQTVVDIATDTIWITVLIATPSLLAALIIGLVVSVFQAATQINEQTLTFIPKILTIFIAFVVCGPWLTRKMMEFTVTLFSMIATVNGT
jgi:flagellar biosynthetic protein FliQ